MNNCQRCDQPLPDTCANDRCAKTRDCWSDPNRQSKYCSDPCANATAMRRRYARIKEALKNG